MTICQHVKVDGTPCKAPAIMDVEDGKCLFHTTDERIVERRRLGRSIGGKVRQMAPQVNFEEVMSKGPVTTIDGVVELLNVAIANALVLPNSINRARALAELSDRLRVAIQARDAGPDDGNWKIHLIAGIAGGKIDYDSVREEFGASLADELFNLSGVAVEAREP